MLASHQPQQNRLLNLLPAEELQRLLPQLELIHLKAGEAIYEAVRQPHYVYFPTSSIISLLYETADGDSAQIAAVGNEGVLGVAVFMGGDTTPGRAVVQHGGYAYRMHKRDLQQRFAEGGELQKVLLRYAQALITQMAQTAVCNRHHSVDRQLCRWLLLSLDRLPGDHSELHMTQELISNLLGVRREGITLAAGKLQHAGLIHYRRGHITVLNRSALEAQACECYQVVKKEFDRLLPGRQAINPS